MAYNIRVYALDDGEKVAQDDLNHFGLTSSLISTSGVVTGGTINLISAKNEVIGFQVMLQNDSTDTASALVVNLESLTNGAYEISNSGWSGSALTGGLTSSTGYWNYVGRRIEHFVASYIKVGVPSSYDGTTSNYYNSRPAASGDTMTQLPAAYYNNRWLPFALVPGEASPSGHQLGLYGAGIQGGFPISISGSRVQSVWIDVYFPSDAPAGTYTGTVVVSSTSDGTISSIPVSVKLYNFALPHQNQYPFGVMGVDMLVHAWARTPCAIATTANHDYALHYDRYGAMLRRHRLEISPRSHWTTLATGLSAFSTTSYQNLYFKDYYTGHRWVSASGYEGPGMSAAFRFFYLNPYHESRTRISSGAHFSASSAAGYQAGAQTWKDYERSLTATLLESDPLNPFAGQNTMTACRAIFYHDDEPREDGGTYATDPLAAIRTKARWMMTTNGSGSALETQVDDSLFAVVDPGISNTASAYLLTGYVTNYASQNSAWGVKGALGHSGPSISGANKLHSMACTATNSAFQAWWYNGTRGNQGVSVVGPPEYPAIEPRVLGWNCYAYRSQFDGWFYWSTTYCTATETNWTQAYRDIWKNDYVGGLNSISNGSVLLPGENRNTGLTNLNLPGPIALFNLKNLRRGIQDYHYFWLASGYSINVIPTLKAVVQGCLDDVPQTYPNNHPFTQPIYHSDRGYEFYNARRTIADLISQEVSNFYTPTPLTPANGSTNVPLTTDVTWSTVPDATAYKLQLEDKEGDWETLDVDVCQGDTVYTWATTKYNRYHQWRVASVSSGATSDWSDTQIFTTAASGTSGESSTASITSAQQIGIVASASGRVTSLSGEVTFPITIPDGQNRYLFTVGWYDSRLGTFSGASAGSQAMTLLKEAGITGYGDKLAIFGLVNPTTGTINVSIVPSTDRNEIAGLAIALTGVMSGNAIYTSGSSTTAITTQINLGQASSANTWGVVGSIHMDTTVSATGSASFAICAAPTSRRLIGLTNGPATGAAIWTSVWHGGSSSALMAGVVVNAASAVSTTTIITSSTNSFPSASMFFGF